MKPHFLVFRGFILTEIQKDLARINQAGKYQIFPVGKTGRDLILLEGIPELMSIEENLRHIEMTQCVERAQRAGFSVMLIASSIR
jgi:hypothetical protein